MPDSEDQTWTLIQEQLRRRLALHQYRTWFQHLRGSRQGDGEAFVVHVPNEFFREWISRNYMETLRDAVHAVVADEPQVALQVSPALVPEEPAAASAAVPDGLPLNPHYTFDQFVTGPSNRLAHAAAKAVSDAPGESYNPLFIHGAVGLGKSHLLQAICLALLSKSRPLRVLYLSCETFVNEFIAAIQTGNLSAFRTRCRRVDALVIDDIQFLARAERTQEEFFHTFNALHNAQRQVVLSSDSEPREIPIQSRLTSRFASGLVARLDAPSIETRMAILRRKAALRDAELPDDVIAYVAESFAANIRELEGALTKLIGYASLSGQPIDLHLALAALAAPKPMSRPLTIQDILTVVANHFRVRIADLQSKKRTRSIVYPRQICMHLARLMTDHSLEEIGGYFGGRDHSTVLHGDAKIREEASRNAATKRLLAKLQQDLVSEA